MTFIDPSFNNLKHVEVLDVIMGSGKTHAALRYIESEALSGKSKWVYCTEFLSEIETRTKEGDAKDKWRTPESDDSSKLEDFIDLLEEPDVSLIAITHQLFRQAMKRDDVIHLVASKGWNLYLDETFDCINAYSGIRLSEFLWHKNAGRLSVDESNYGKVKWEDNTVFDYETSDMSIFKLLKHQENVHAYVSGNQVSIVEIDNEVMFNVWNRIILSTYQFEGTLMEAYFRMKGIKWKECTDIVPSKTTSKQSIKEKVTMLHKYDKAFERLALSSTWYEEKALPEHFALINKTIRNIGDSNGCKGNPEKMGYTLPKSVLGKQTDKRKVQPKGYNHTVCLIDADGKEIEGSVCKKRSGHIPCNARASNEYAVKEVMVHIYDRYPNHVVANYLRGTNVSYSKERFAVNELVQWLWRSGIRDGKKITVAILSKRMRELFLKWLND